MLRENAKEEVLKNEGNAYFQRNMRDGKIEIAKGCMLFDEFLQNYQGLQKNMRILEVGCCYGYNLTYLCEKYDLEGYGIEPSKEAVDYGNDVIKKDKNKRVILSQGTADELKFPSEYFDIVMMAFCMFWVDRKYVMRAVAEADRVLKTGGGVLAIWDFDTRIPYRRTNIHNENVPTYKYQLAELFLGNPQYDLIEKNSFSHMGRGLHQDIQERCALNVLYKDAVEDAYIFSD